MRYDFKSLPLLESEEARDKRRKTRNEWIQTVLVWTAVAVLLFMLDTKAANACGDVSTECAQVLSMNRYEIPQPSGVHL